MAKYYGHAGHYGFSGAVSNAINCGGPEGTRTPYLYNANVALYQMSYRPFGSQEKQNEMNEFSSPKQVRN
jgi:hypothetical protein